MLGRKYTTIPSNHITRAKNEPYTPPSAELNMNTDVITSALIGNIYKFAYSYVYIDGSESRLSPYSKTIYPVGSTDKIPSYYFNEVSLSVNTGDETVRAINIHMLSTNGVWSLFKTIEKENNLGTKLVDDNITYEYVYNGSDSLTEVVDKTGFNSVPQSSTSSCFSSVGRVIDGNTTEFYDYQNIDFDLYGYVEYVENNKIVPLHKNYNLANSVEMWTFPEYTGRPFIIFCDIEITWVKPELLPSGYTLPIIGKYGASYVVDNDPDYPSSALFNIRDK